MAGYFRLIPALRHPSFTQRKNSVFLCTRICGAGTKFALETICLMKVRYFLVAIAVCLMLSVCSGCYGAGYDRSIPARAFPSGDVLEISTGAELNPGLYIAYGANQFSTDLSLSALVQKIYRDGAVFQTVSTPSQGSIGTLIWVPQGNGTRDVYYLEKVGQGGEKNWYLFSGLCYKLYNDRESTDSILFPFIGTQTVTPVEREWRDPLPPALFLRYAGNGMTSLSGGRIFGCCSSGCMALSTRPISR